MTFNEQNKILEITPSKTEGKDTGYDIDRSLELSEVVSEAETLLNSIEHDSVVTVDDIHKLGEKLDRVSFTIEGESLTFSELKKIPNLKNDREIWEEMRKGYFTRIGELTFLPRDLVGVLTSSSSRNWFLENGVALPNLEVLSYGAASLLARFPASFHLGLRELPDEIAEVFSRDDWTPYIETTSPEQRILNFDRVTTLSEEAARLLSQTKGFLGLRGIVSLSSVAIEHLTKLKGKIFCPLTPLAREGAKMK